MNKSSKNLLEVAGRSLDYQIAYSSVPLMVNAGKCFARHGRNFRSI